MNWKDVGASVIKAGAPLLGGALLGPAGAAVGAIIANQFGEPDATPKQINQLISADPEAALKLADIENRHRERLIELENDSFKIATQDMQHARQMHQDSWMPWALTFVLAIMVSGIVSALIWVAIPDSNREVIYLVVGQLIGAFSTAVAYWLGSSRGSAAKDIQLSKAGLR